jgi:hypothetical protein
VTEPAILIRMKTATDAIREKISEERDARGRYIDRQKRRPCATCGGQIRKSSYRKYCSRKCYGVAQIGRPTALGMCKRNTAPSFWAAVGAPEPITGCRVWLHGRDRDGYGKIKFNGRYRRAHAVAYELTTGITLTLSPRSAVDVPIVLHSCDNPPCCEPTHLRLGTHADNSSDCIGRERQATGDKNGSRLHPERLARGSSHGKAKLTEAQAVAIRKKRAAGESLDDIASEYNMSRSNIWSITSGKTWIHVKEDDSHG